MAAASPVDRYGQTQSAAILRGSRPAADGGGTGRAGRPAAHRERSGRETKPDDPQSPWGHTRGVAGELRSDQSGKPSRAVLGSVGRS